MNIQQLSKIIPEHREKLTLTVDILGFSLSHTGYELTTFKGKTLSECTKKMTKFIQKRYDILTQQERWQKEQVEKGNCMTCGKPSDGKARCPSCREKIAKRVNKKDKETPPDYPIMSY